MRQKYEILTTLCLTHALIWHNGFIRHSDLSLLSVQCEWALGQRIDVTRGIWKCLHATFWSWLASQCAPRVRVCCIANFNFAVYENIWVLSKKLEGLSAPALRVSVGRRKKAYSIVNSASIKRKKKDDWKETKGIKYCISLIFPLLRVIHFL